MSTKPLMVSIGSQMYSDVFQELCYRENWHCATAEKHVILPFRWEESLRGDETLRSVISKKVDAWSRALEVFILLDTYPSSKVDVNEDIAQGLMLLVKKLSICKKVSAVNVVLYLKDTTDSSSNFFNRLNSKIRKTWADAGLTGTCELLNPWLVEKEVSKEVDPRTPWGSLTSYALNHHLFQVLDYKVKRSLKQSRGGKVKAVSKASKTAVSLAKPYPPPKANQANAVASTSSVLSPARTTLDELLQAEKKNHAETKLELQAVRAEVRRLTFAAGQRSPDQEFIKMSVMEILPSLTKDLDIEDIIMKKLDEILPQKLKSFIAVVEEDKESSNSSNIAIGQGAEMEEESGSPPEPHPPGSDPEVDAIPEQPCDDALPLLPSGDALPLMYVQEEQWEDTAAELEEMVNKY